MHANLEYTGGPLTGLAPPDGAPLAWRFACLSGQLYRMGNICKTHEGAPVTRAGCPHPANIALLFTLLALAGCAGESGRAASVTGNEQGGKVPYAEGGMPSAMEAAKAHCSQFGKKAQIIQMTTAPEGGGTVGFQCR